MAINEELAEKIKKALSENNYVEEKKMFGGVCFMVNGKMCICVRNNEFMCRVEDYGTALQKEGTRPMIHNGKAMKNCVFVQGDSIKSKEDFEYWIDASLAFNAIAKPSKKK